MTYATRDNMLLRFGEREIEALTDHDAVGAIDEDALTLAMADADAEVDAYLGRRYDVPIATPPDHLVRVACDLARFNLYDHDVPEAVQALRDSALAWLRDVAASRIDLPGVDDKVDATSAGDAELVGPDRVFSRDKLGHF